MKYKLENHIIGKVYDLTQENMLEMVNDIEELKIKYIKAIEALFSIACLHVEKQDSVKYWLGLSSISIAEVAANDTKLARETLKDLGEL